MTKITMKSLEGGKLVTKSKERSAQIDEEGVGKGCKKPVGLDRKSVV